MKKIALFPGSFDPFTNGHFDIVNRGLRLFDEIIIGIGTNASKKRYFELDSIDDGLNEAFKNQPRVTVIHYDELTATIAKKLNANFILRGLRNTTDFEYENTISQVNRRLSNDLETVFLITSPELAPISSTIVRELHKFGADISEYIPYKIDMLEKLD
jgi:pantetheine-phosphate adenylyltransferase